MHGDPNTPLDDSPQAVARRHRQTWLALAGVVVAVLALVAIYHWFTRPAPLPGTGETLTARQVAAVAKPLVARLETVNASGKPQFAGFAVTTAEGEMLTTCHNLVAGRTLQVVFHDGSSRAESARANRAANICVLKVATTGRTSARLRGDDPAGGERIYVVQVKAADTAPELVETRVANPIAEANGMMFGIDSKESFTTGAAVFDTQGRLVGIVSAPHTLGDFPLAYSATRIAKARGAQRPSN
jgi:hypothetical protein